MKTSNLLPIIITVILSVGLEILLVMSEMFKEAYSINPIASIVGGLFIPAIGIGAIVIYIRDVKLNRNKIIKEKV